MLFQMTFGEQNTEKEAHEMLSYSFDHGINILDTAEAVSPLLNFFTFALMDILDWVSPTNFCFVIFCIA